ncbi:MAG TPA: hypothetical protein VGJ92_02070 [Methanocella sp.]|jgi:succinate-acetate transporter protein
MEDDTGKALIKAGGGYTGIFGGANVFHRAMADILNVTSGKILPTG